MFIRSIFSVLAAYSHATVALSQETPQYSDREFETTCISLFNVAVGQARDSSTFVLVKERMFSEDIMQQIGKIGYILHIEGEEVFDGSLELQLTPPEPSGNETTWLLPNHGAFVPYTDVNIDYFFCRAEPISQTIFQIGVRMQNEDNDAGVFYVSPALAAESLKQGSPKL